MSENKSKPICVNCVHYYVTWDKNFPNGCKLFGFKSSKTPGLTVKRSIGQSCDNFVGKHTKK